VLIRFGARAAQPGEFTKRAFLNGRLDLAQAEAVADLIHARSERAHESSLAQLNGSLSRRIVGLRDRLIASMSLLELELDFVEEGYEFAEKAKVAEQLRDSLTQIEELLDSYKVGKIYRDGVKVAIAGAPNVGKSSLLNALLKEDRAIVTNIPGTTRDTIEESITLGGVLFDLSDTAGLRETADPVEQEGVRRAEEKMEACDILILLLDSTRPLLSAEAELADRFVRRIEARGAGCLVAINKVDLVPVDTSMFTHLAEILSRHPVLEISAKTHYGFKGLEDELVRVAVGGSVSSADSGSTITNARHYSALNKARRCLSLALESLLAGKSGEFVAVDLRAGLDALGEIVGVVTTDDILNSIFARFCIGK
jgi:tRNA modification GTPase